MYRAKPNIAADTTPGALVKRSDDPATWTILATPFGRKTPWPRLWVLANTDGVQTVDLRDPSWVFA